MQSPLGRTALVSLLALFPVAAPAGPPLVCFPMAIGNARSLAWAPGSGWKGALPDYDRAKLTADTLSLLGPETGVLARMETLRRAVIYAATDEAGASGLFAGLRKRAAGGPSGKAGPLAEFDLGYAVAAWGEARHVTHGAFAVVAPGEDGYALVRRALAARGPDPEMEYAAALMTLGLSSRGPSDEHLQVAVRGATPGSPLAATIAAHHDLWDGRAEALRANAGR